MSPKQLIFLQSMRPASARTLIHLAHVCEYPTIGALLYAENPWQEVGHALLSRRPGHN